MDEQEMNQKENTDAKEMPNKTKKVVKKAKKVTAQKILDESAKATKKSSNMLFAPTILRVFFGIIFMLHGAQKLFGVLGGGGISGTTQFFQSIPAIAWAASLFAVLVAIIEFFGGIILIIGAFTRISASLLGVIMLVAMVTVHLQNGFFAPGGIEMVLLLLAGCISLVLSGPGNWAIMQKY